MFNKLKAFVGKKKVVDEKAIVRKEYFEALKCSKLMWMCLSQKDMFAYIQKATFTFKKTVAATMILDKALEIFMLEMFSDKKEIA